MIIDIKIEYENQILVIFDQTYSSPHQKLFDPHTLFYQKYITYLLSVKHCAP